jgi:hypothetical protein
VHPLEAEAVSERIIDPNDVAFQQGRYLYDAQILHANAKTGETIESARIMEICVRYCHLISHVGLLRAECNRLDEQLKTWRRHIEQIERWTRPIESDAHNEDRGAP